MEEETLGKSEFQTFTLYADRQNPILSTPEVPQQTHESYSWNFKIALALWLPSFAPLEPMKAVCLAVSCSMKVKFESK
jgi:hypothetical protein